MKKIKIRNLLGTFHDPLDSRIFLEPSTKSHGSSKKIRESLFFHGQDIITRRYANSLDIIRNLEMIKSDILRFISFNLQ